MLAAVLFGASTPFAKALIGSIQPALLAGLLYLGSGIGLLVVWGLRHGMQADAVRAESAYLTRQDLPWFAGAILFGGVIGPLLLMVGLVYTPGSTASLLLNLEGVFTALLAWVVFRENVDRRILLGMACIVGAGVVLSWEQVPQAGGIGGIMAIAGACLCWAIDNNLTRRISASDALQIASLKGLVAGVVNVALALGMGAQLPGVTFVLPAMTVGFFGYGISLVLFVLALRHLGTARTGAYFSLAPFIGAVISFMLLRESPGMLFLVAGAAMAVGLWLHLTERHDHLHTHSPMAHRHMHSHDEHHQHSHEPGWDGTEPHSHTHYHPPLTHRHPHYPDIHHRHSHKPDGDEHG